MNVKASGRSALIIAAGIWICIGAPMQLTAAIASPDVSRAEAKTKPVAPAASKKTTKHRHLSEDAVAKPRKSGETTAKFAPSAEPAIAASRDDQLPPTVANANAQLPSANGAAGGPQPAQVDEAAPVTARIDPPTAQAPAAGATAPAEIVASDELNDLDLAASDSKTTLVAQAGAATAEVKAVDNAGDDGAWSKSSLIGKIFIAFGGLLTLASAARMFMA